jgi:hypothetical protein
MIHRLRFEPGDSALNQMSLSYAIAQSIRTATPRASVSGGGADGRICGEKFNKMVAGAKESLYCSMTPLRK